MVGTQGLVVAVSVGQTKVAAAALSIDGRIIQRTPETSSPRGNGMRTVVCAEMAAALAKQVGVDKVIRIGISFPECVPPPQRVAYSPRPMLADRHEIQCEIERTIRGALRSKVEIEILHDAGAAALGESSPMGSIPGCGDYVFVVWGTGIASGVVRAGRLYWNDPKIGMMVSELGMLAVHTGSGIYEYRPTRHKPALGSEEATMDGWLSGPPLTAMMRRRIRDDPRGQALLRAAGVDLETLGLIEINNAARCGDPLASDLIETAGREMGAALLPFVVYWHSRRKMPFVRTIVIGSGVAKLGEKIERKGKGVLIEAVRREISVGLERYGITDYDETGVVLSKIGYEREFYAFVPFCE